jgi:hypothetical protein
MAAGPSNAISDTDAGPAHQIEDTSMPDDQDPAENVPGPAAKVRKQRKQQPKAVPARKSARQH